MTFRICSIFYWSLYRIVSLVALLGLIDYFSTLYAINITIIPKCVQQNRQQKNAKKSIFLQCTEQRLHSIPYEINITKHNRPQRCPESFDYLGKLRQASHMCTAAVQSFACVFTLSNVIVTKDGGLVDCNSMNGYSFQHSSMGKLEPLYDPVIHKRWGTYYTVSI